MTATQISIAKLACTAVVLALGVFWRAEALVLLVLLRPKVVNSEQEAERITREVARERGWPPRRCTRWPRDPQPTRAAAPPEACPPT